MIYELTTYTLKPRTVPKVEALFASACPQRVKHSELIGSFHTEFGPLNEIVQIWKYENFAERSRVNDLVARDGTWPPKIADSLISMQTEIMTPVSFSRELKPGQLGPYFEFRTYKYPLGGLGKMMAAWERAMPMRDALGSPVAAIWTTEIGAMNSLTHIWPYHSLQERENLRKEVRKSGMWPPFKLAEAQGRESYEVISQSNKLMLASSFSPLQ